MFRVSVLGVAGLCILSVAPLAGQKPSFRSHLEVVEVDAVVEDNNGQAVVGLRQEDFQIKEDGRPVAVTNFAEVSASGIAGESDARSLVLVLDDTGMNPTATTRVQAMARMFIDHMTPVDHVAVIRLRHREDEPVGGRQQALARIDAYRSGSYPLLDDTLETWLKTLAKLARELQLQERRRTVVVGIGNPSVFDVYLPVPQESLLWPFWMDALTATADANVSVYVVDPSGVTGRFDLGDGLVDQTGGQVFVKSNNFARAAELIWRDAGHYYVLAYAPTTRARELHSIEVTVKRPGLHVHARQSRGD
jgi:VWFA-related protein